METKCAAHSEPYQMFCKTCSQNVCLDCIASDKHKTHSFDRFETVAHEYRIMIQKYTKTLLPEQIEKLTTNLSRIQTNQDKNRKSVADVTSQIEQRKSSLVESAENASKDLLKQLDERSQTNVQKLAKSEKENEEKLKELNNVQVYCTRLESMSDLEVIGKADEIKQMVSFEWPSSCPDIEFYGFKMSTSCVTSNYLGEICLESETNYSGAQTHETSHSKRKRDKRKKSTTAHVAACISVEQTSGKVFKEIHKVVECLCVTDGEEFGWFGCQGSKKLSLVNSDGVILRTIDLTVSIHSVSRLGSNSLLALTKERLKKINLDTNNCTTFIHLSPLYPTCMCTSKTGEVLACLVDSFSQPSKHIAEMTRMVNIYSDSGVLLSTCNEVSGQRFSLPWCIAYDSNANLVAVFDKHLDQIFTFDRESVVKYSYFCQNISSMVFDNNGNLLIADRVTNAVYMLDIEGNYVEDIVSLSSSPRCIALDDSGLLLIGCSDGEIVKVLYSD